MGRGHGDDAPIPGGQPPEEPADQRYPLTVATETWDVVVVGGGAAGMMAARAAAAEDASVLLVEREAQLGGECTFTGCVPSKTLIEVARTYWRARSARGWGIVGDGITIDFSAVMAHKDRVVEEVAADEQAEAFESAGITVRHGHAEYLDSNRIAIDAVEHRFEKTVVATGTDPAVPPIPGLAEAPHLTNETIFSLEQQPSRLLVLGGGAIGLELGQAFSRLGTEVVVLEQEDRVLPIEDPDTSGAVADILGGEGLDLRTGWTVTGSRPSGDGVALVATNPIGESETLFGDAVLVATGRTPRTSGFGLERLGVTWNRAGIAVDERMRTGASNAWAAGDVTGGLQFTHVASAEGVVAGRNAAGKKVKVDLSAVPWVTFLDPEVGRVGLTEEQARASHKGVEVTRLPMSRLDRARILGQTTGFVKLVMGSRRLIGSTGGGQLLGAHVVGPSAGELVNEAALLMRTNAFAGRLAQSIHAYPTMGIGLQMSASQLWPLGRALLGNEE